MLFSLSPKPVLALAATLVFSVTTMGCQRQTAPTPTIPEAPIEAPAKPAPAIWKVSDADTTLYLFGTIHILHKDLDWRSEEISAAWNEAKTVYFETDTGPEAQADLAKLIPQIGLNAPGTTLEQYFDEDQWTVVSKTANDLGINVIGLQQMRPWLAGILISVQMIVADGGDPEAGVDNILASEAKARGKKIRFFETPEEQIRFFADMSDKESALLLIEGLEFYQSNPGYFQDLVNLWLAGDEDGIGAILIEGLTGSEEFADTLLYNRNRAWVEELSRVMTEEQGVFFVAVGAGHLAGDKSVQDYLSQKGFVAERLN